MRFKKYINESKQKWPDNKIINVLSKGLDYDDVFSQIAMSLRNYNKIDTFDKIYLQKNNNKLMDELWYRTASAIEKSERFDPKFMKTLKKNFYSLEKTLFKDYKKIDNFYTTQKNLLEGKVTTFDMKKLKYFSSDTIKKFLNSIDWRNKRISQDNNIVGGTQKDTRLFIKALIKADKLSTKELGFGETKEQTHDYKYLNSI